MKKYFFIMLFVLFLFFLPKLVASQESASGKAYADFTKNYRYYQSLIDPFNVAKSKYSSFGSVSSSAEYLEASKKLLLAEVNALSSFALYVKLKLAEETKILEYKDSKVYVILDDEITFLNLFKEEIAKISSLEENKKSWSSFKEHFNKIQTASLEAKSSIEIGKAKKIFIDLKDINEKMSIYLEDKKPEEQNTQAAKDKYQNLSVNFNFLESLISEIESEQNNYQINTSQKTSTFIRSKITQAINSFNNLISGYSNIIDTLQ